MHFIWKTFTVLCGFAYITKKTVCQKNCYMLSSKTILRFLDILTVQRKRFCGQRTSKISEGPVMTFNLIILIPMNMFVLLVMIVHICYLSGDVDHSVCLAITIVRTRGGGEDYALRVHVDPDLHVSILGSGF